MVVIDWFLGARSEIEVYEKKSDFAIVSSETEQIFSSCLPRSFVSPHA